MTLIGQIVEGRYLVEGELGAGAMGRVYYGRHVKVGRRVALKVLHAELASEPAVVERFHREARIAARLSHPNLVGVLDIGSTDDGDHVMVLELAPGRPLADLLGAPVARAQIIDRTSQILRGLEHAHAAGLVHRDLKPDNVLVESLADGRELARIVDFGIAIVAHDGSIDSRRLTDAGLVVGTPQYMAPEQALGQPVDARTDLYALGVMVYEMLAGVTPFAGTGVEVVCASVTSDAPAIAVRAPGVVVDASLEGFVRRLVARRPDDRFSSARDALAALEQIDHVDTVATRPMTVITPTPRRRRGWGTIAATALVMIAITGWAGNDVDAEAPTIELAAPASDLDVVVRGTAKLEIPAMPVVIRRAPDHHVAPPIATVAIEPPETTPRELADRYVILGRALFARRVDVDDLWERYRRIQIHTALATADTRTTTLQLLAGIERDLAAR